MKPARNATVEEFRLQSRMDAVRKRLLDSATDLQLDLSQPLAFWAFPSDRRLPLAFLGRSLQNILATPMDDLYSTPGIGNKKIESLVKLLERAADMPIAPAINGHGGNNGSGNNGSEHSGSEHSGSEGQNGQDHEAPQTFDAADVSEGTWLQWRTSVKNHELHSLKLGRLAASLQSLPTVIWEKPIGDYLDCTVTEIRQLKTHGEKRVRAVLEVFYHIHSIVANVPHDSMFRIRLIPTFVSSLDRWVDGLLTEQPTRPPSYEELLQCLARPLLAQIRIDCGDVVADLAGQRLGIDGEVHSVKRQSESLGVTRARIYQLLHECNQALRIRWPEGEGLMRKLDRLVDGSEDHRVVSTFDMIQELFFGSKPIGSPTNATAEPLQFIDGSVASEPNQIHE